MLYRFDVDDGGEAGEAEVMRVGEEAGEAGETRVGEETGQAGERGKVGDTDVFARFETDLTVVTDVPRDLMLMVAARGKAKGAPHC
jgi:hypothetical protein